MVAQPKIFLTRKGLHWFGSGHPWIFSSDIDKKETDAPGVVAVVGPDTQFLAQALYSPHSKIGLRILSYKPEAVDAVWWKNKIARSIQKRQRLSIASNAKRFVFGEADGLPSLIVDGYAGIVVVQILSAGLETCKSFILDALQEALSPSGILEKNDVAVRDLEKLPRINAVAQGEVPATVVIREGTLEFVVDPWKGQKTGAFLDQRDNRFLAGQLATGMALDVFSYNGWFACHMAEKSDTVICVESSEEAAESIRNNARRNGAQHKIKVIVANAFDFLKAQEEDRQHFDTINLDPPAFIKSAKEKEGGYRGYKEINLRAMKLLNPAGILSSASCSQAFTSPEFEMMLADAAIDTHTALQILYRRGAAPDHPSLVTFPESNYLKCFFCHVS